MMKSRLHWMIQGLCSEEIRANELQEPGQTLTHKHSSSFSKCSFTDRNLSPQTLWYPASGV